MQSNQILKFLIFLSVILINADALTSTSLVFNILGYCAFLLLSFVLIDFKKIPDISIYIFSILILIFCICGLFKANDIFVILKYILLGSAFSMTFMKRRKLDKSIFVNILLIPYLLLLAIGFIQLIFLITAPNLIIPIMNSHFRPIGLSSEPTFYSQQILMFAILCDIFNLKIKKYNPLINMILIFLIISCATRSTMLMGCLFLLLKLSSSKNKLFILPFLSLNFIVLSSLKQVQEFFGYIGFNSRLNSLISISGEPREIALKYMLEKMNSIPLFGYGFIEKLAPNSNLTVGSLYANTPLAIFYTLGFLSIPIFFICFFKIYYAMKNCYKFPILTTLFFGLVMPFLYTNFGFLCIILATTPKKYIKHLNA